MNSKLNRNKSTVYIAGGILLVAIVVGYIWFSNAKGDSADKAAQLYSAGNVSAASEEYSKLLKQFGGSSDLWNKYGNTLRDLKKYDEAASAYKQAIHLDANNNLAFRNLSYLAVDMEELAGKQGAVDDAINVIESNYKKSSPAALYLSEDLIMLYGKKGNHAKVTEWTKVREELLKQ